MKKHTPSPPPIADEQLLFTPEEMIGEVTPPDGKTPVGDLADADAGEQPTASQPKQDTIAHTPPADNAQIPAKQQRVVPAETKTSPTEAATLRTDESFDDEDRIITEMTIALEFTDSLTLGQIRLIALEASVIWQNGVRPSGTYSIQSMPHYTFDGYKFLAFYYVTFYRAFPSMIEKLNLPYDRLYLLARRRYDGYREKL